MAFRLVLLRHADAEADEARPDFERRLSPQGHKEAVRIGVALAARGVHPDLIVSSPANRALATVVLAAPAIGYPIERIVTDPAVYEASLPALLDVIQRHAKGVECLLVAGHNPGLRQVGMALGHLGEDWAMLKGHAALFTIEGGWGRLVPGGARLDGVVAP